MDIYADNAGTTKMSRPAIAAMLECMENVYGNPSSLHTTGQRAAEIIATARENMATLLGCTPKEIYFTSGGSESDNQAILTAASIGEKKGKKHIITTAFEHHAVYDTVKKLEKQGYDATYLDVHPDGIISIEQLNNAIRDDTCLVTIMYANNEIGTIQPIADIAKICNERGVFFHTDAVQAAGHLHIDVKSLGIDMLSLAAHKFHGPKGVGLLYAKKGILVAKLIEGGAQESGKRGGTENVPGIVSMAAAFKDVCENADSHASIVARLRDRLIEGLEKIPHSILNGHRTTRLPNNVNLCFEGIEGESLLLMLDQKGIRASSGSACTSGSLEPSHVLLAIGRPHEIAHGSLRLTLSHDNNDEEVDYIIESVSEVVARLRDFSPLWKDMEEGRKQHVI